MNCNEIRKYIFAFADGQLGVKENCEVLDHLKMCPDCGTLVTEHQSLRSAVNRSLARVPVPASLRNRIQAALQAGDAKPSLPAASRTLLRIRPLAAAACLLLVASIALWTSFRGNDSARASAGRVNKVQRGPMAASLIAKVHNTCSEHAYEHHHDGLPRRLDDLPASLAVHYENRIVPLAPNFASHDFQFESAGYCAIREKPGSNGGHLMYVASDGKTRLSFFSVPRWDCLDHCAHRGIANDENLREYDVEQPDGTKLAVIAWHNDATTYICCGPVPIPKMEQMVREIRSTLANSESSERP